MDKIAFLWLGIGIAVGSFLFQTEISEALYSIPPTPAFKTFYISNEGTVPNSDINNITAVNSFDFGALVSDGSIIINITEFNP